MRRLFLFALLGALAGSPLIARTAGPTPDVVSVAAVAPCGEFRGEVEQVLTELGGYDLSEPGCAAVKRFQERYGLKPVDGIAGPATKGVARRLADSDPSDCDAAADGDLVVCVDLTHQTTWIMSDGEVLHGPTVMRSGMKDFATPTGTFHVQWRATRTWSEPYEVWLPHWQSFNGDIGFHQTTTYLHNPKIGSHGCINLLPQDAVAYWETLYEGATVQVFGHRAGT